AEGVECVVGGVRGGVADAWERVVLEAIELAAQRCLGRPLASLVLPVPLSECPVVRKPRSPAGPGKVVFLSRIGIEHDLVCRNHACACAAWSAFAARCVPVVAPDAR